MPRLAFLLLALTLVACESEPATDAPADASRTVRPSEPIPAPGPPEVTTPTSVILVDYEGRLEDGTVFDSGENTEFRLVELIPGMQRELTGMRAGESKMLTLPPEEAYGPGGIPGVIPPNATLTFDVTVHEILR